MLQSRGVPTDNLSMEPNISAIEGGSQADTLQAAVQTKLLRKSMELQKTQVLELLANTARPGLGTKVNLIA